MLNDRQLLRQQNLARQPAWHRGQEKPKAWDADDWLVAFGGEVGEMLNEVKKLNRLKHGIVGDETNWKQKVIDLSFEIADCVLYLDLLCDHFGFDANEFPEIGESRDIRKNKPETASQMGRELLEYVGHVSRYSHRFTEQGVRSWSLLHSLIRTYRSIYRIANLFDIDVKAAIERKFNITTAQHTLGVELHFQKEEK